MQTEAAAQQDFVKRCAKRRAPEYDVGGAAVHEAPERYLRHACMHACTTGTQKRGSGGLPATGSRRRRVSRCRDQKH